MRIPHRLASCNHKVQASIAHSGASMQVQMEQGGAATSRQASESVVVHLLAASQAEGLQASAATGQGAHGTTTD